MQWFRQTKTLIWVTVLAANFPDAEAVGAKTWFEKFLIFLSDQKLSTKPAHLHLSFRTFAN
jgi:hypothetical protein